MEKKTYLVFKDGGNRNASDTHAMMYVVTPNKSIAWVRSANIVLNYGSLAS